MDDEAVVVVVLVVVVIPTSGDNVDFDVNVDISVSLCYQQHRSALEMIPTTLSSHPSNTSKERCHGMIRRSSSRWWGSI